MDDGPEGHRTGGPRTAPTVFLSYRRDDVPDATDRLADSLIKRLGRDQVFLDVDSIDIGAPFAKVIHDWVSRCDVLLALIGPGWLAATDDEGARRLDNPKDYVRLEVEAGLARDMRVVPVLIHGARMPMPSQLPSSLLSLLDRNALELTRTHWQFDVNKLIEGLERATPAHRSQAAERRRAQVAAAARDRAELGRAERPPGVVGTPQLNGSPRVARKLTVTNACFESVEPITLAYEWQRRTDAHEENVEGASEASFVPSSGDAGSAVRARIVATNAYGSTDVTTPWSAAIARPRRAPTNRTDGRPWLGSRRAAAIAALTALVVGAALLVVSIGGDKRDAGSPTASAPNVKPSASASKVKPASAPSVGPSISVGVAGESPQALRSAEAQSGSRAPVWEMRRAMSQRSMSAGMPVKERRFQSAFIRRVSL